MRTALLAFALGTLTGAARPADPPPPTLDDRAPPAKQPLERPAGGHVTAARFEPDGKTLLTVGTDRQVVRWDVATQRVLGTVPLRPAGGVPVLAPLNAAAFSPDGVRLAAVTTDGKLAVFNTDTGVQEAALDLPKGLPPDDARVALAGKRVLVSAPGRLGNQPALVVAAADPAAGKPFVVRTLVAPDGLRLDERRSAAALSPDGATAAVALLTHSPAEQGELVVFDAADGKTLRSAGFAYGNFAMALAVAPDGRSVAVTGSRDRLVLWDAGRGRLRHTFDVSPLGYLPPAFAADGRTVAVVTGKSVRGKTRHEDYRIRVLEVATGEVRFELDPGSYVTALALSPDGSAAAAGLRGKTPAAVWDLSPAAGPKPWEESPTDPGKLWLLLADGTAKAAWPAIRELVARPDAAVRLFKERIKVTPAPAKPDAAGVAKLIRQLDAAAFADRQAAEKALRDLGPQVEAELRAALAETKSAEVRAKLEALIERIDRIPAGGRAEVRAVEVLERIGTPAARELLAAFAAGAGHTGLTAEAKAAAGRLK
jgi:hypothetical protein